MRPINLLPPESAERLRSRRLVSRLFLAGLAFLAVLALASVLLTTRIGDAEGRLETQLAANARLEQQLSTLRDVQTLQQRYDTDATLIRAALAGEVSWGRILNDLGRMIPDRVWLLSFIGVAEVGDATRGTLDVAANGIDVPDVSAWLRSLDSDRFPTVAGTWVPTVQSTSIGPNDVWTFSSRASLTPAAESGRAELRIPVVGR